MQYEQETARASAMLHISDCEKVSPESARGRGRRFLATLESRGILDAPAVRRAASAQSRSGEPLEVILLELGLVPEHLLHDALCDALGIDRVSIEDAELPDIALLGLDLPYLIRHNVFLLGFTDTAVSVATGTPLNDDVPRALAYAAARELDLKIASLASIARRLREVSEDGRPDPVPGGPAAGDEAVPDADAERLRDLASEAPVIRLLSRLVGAAIERGASDVHVEPLSDCVRIRFRVDGALQVHETHDKAVQSGLVSRIKILARLNIAEQRLPQDGRIRLAIKGREVDFRVSTTPTAFGESAVLRILDRHDVALNFAALGFEDRFTTQLERLAACPNGIILVTGPTGSGKTTTLYAALSGLNTPDRKLFTVEDPIEYHLEGVNQIPVRPHVGLDFAAVLRSVLRQDPDIIMIGEIRDPETARIAVQAALTGHLVLSTLHTNSAAASLTRLRNIGVEDFLTASTVRGIVAQRLVRKLCVHCRTPIHTGKPAPQHRPVSTHGLKQFYRAEGCGRCNGTGYLGRTSIHEILEMTDTMREAVLRGAAETELESLARAEGMVRLSDCAATRIARGDTTPEEVMRVISLEGQ